MIEYEALCDRNPQRPLFIYGLGKTNYIQVNEIGFDNIGVDAATTGSSGGHGSRSESTESAVPGGRRNHFPGHHAGGPGERVAVKRIQTQPVHAKCAGCIFACKVYIW